MTGPEHYTEAECLLGYAAQNTAGCAEEQYHLAAAQVHATLALAAATAMQAPVDGSEPGMSGVEFAAWYRAAGVEIPREG